MTVVHLLACNHYQRMNRQKWRRLVSNHFRLAPPGEDATPFKLATLWCSRCKKDRTVRQANVRLPKKEVPSPDGEGTLAESA